MHYLKDLSSFLSDGLEEPVSASCYQLADHFLDKIVHIFSKLESRLQARLDLMRWL